MFGNYLPHKPKKVLILGSGALKIGEAGEFDYSGSQAIKALREEGIRTVLVNPNIATIQTSENMADRVYFLPVDPYFVGKVIERERVDAILLSFGGQTALNCGVELYRSGALKDNHVRVLGTPVETILDTEDRARFIDVLSRIGVKTARSVACANAEQARRAVQRIGLPVILRGAFALGGKGSAIVRTVEELDEVLPRAFAGIPQVLVEECLSGWKEVEYEVVRDARDNCITVCNMENIDPLGIHTGESIVVAPSQTLTNHDYHMLRAISIKVIRTLGIIGECNIQYALCPDTGDYRVIEVNARLSRSSALASKATGYPLAYVAAKLALGYTLVDLANVITRRTAAFFEPALDYLVLKIPRWDLEKFQHVRHELGPEMKSVGEVMAIGRRFEEVVQKALRMLHIGVDGLAFSPTEHAGMDDDALRDAIARPSPRRLFAIAEGFRRGFAVSDVAALTHIDAYFLMKLRAIVEMESRLKAASWPLDKETLREAKQMGFSDRQIGRAFKHSEDAVRALRHSAGLTPCVKQIDTLAAEYPAETNYLYLTYNADFDDVTPTHRDKILVLGSGAYRIGSSVEFDWCCVNAVETCRRLDYESILLNYNPETVSTDYDVCDRLYFDEISVETVRDLWEKEQPQGVVVSVGGQVPNNLAMTLAKAGVRLLGTSAESIDRAEDRHKFSSLCDQLKIDQPDWAEASSAAKLAEAAQRLGFPILVRPSYVLSGAAMCVAYNEDQLINYVSKATRMSPEHPIVVSKYEVDSKEIEIDAVADKGELVAYALSEHVEKAGVHSGDATLMLPAQKVYLRTLRKIKQITRKISRELAITGPFNIQFLARDNMVKVIECNLRASRSFPFVSKTTKVNFIQVAVERMLGHARPVRADSIDLDYIAIKAPQFSFSRLGGADPMLGVEMASTGEVACFGNDVEEALLKSLLSTGFHYPKKGVMLCIGRERDKQDFVESARQLASLGLPLYGTAGTAAYLTEQGLSITPLHKEREKKSPSVVEYLHAGKIDLVVNIHKEYSTEETQDGYLIRRAAVDLGIPLFTNFQLARRLARAMVALTIDQLDIRAWDEYQP
ncbi:MAG: carbamoyl-phosphate synthase (glutamine-hydrolyzing) large subunit [Myxococcales bacterium]|nr:MAG: carbamoyl-phosphate synthase (glutamine-hydrolyzing) large subunit [Myxococcales bacterium]